MGRDVIRYVFREDVPIAEVQASLVLSIMAVESLHGAAQVRLDAAHFIEPEHHACAIDAATTVGRDLNRLFVGFISREFGADHFRVDHIDDAPSPKQLRPIVPFERSCKY